MKLLAFFQLIRWKNLLIIILIEVLIKFILIPKFVIASIFGNFNFFLFVSAVLFISAAGYIINAICDHKIDQINKEYPIVIGHSISIYMANILFYIFLLIGLVLGLFVSIHVHQPILFIYFIGTGTVLYIYSKNIKAIPVIDNFVVAILIGLGIFIIVLFEEFNSNTLIYKIILAYSIFGFGINFIREIIKDSEDINGDYSGKIESIPILIGRTRTNQILFILSILFTISIVVILVLNKSISDYFFYYGLIVVLLPLVYFISKIYDATSKQDYKKLSNLSKLIMLLGILSIFTL